VALEQNLFDVSPDKVADVKVMATVMVGEITHRDGL
jgi:predicted amidohydrolase YtcJ